MKLKVGIFFGGPSREREQSYLSGQAVYEYLDRALFEPIPVFVDHHCQFIQLNWPALHRESIRDFYPDVGLLPPSPHAFRIYADSLGELPESDRDRLIDRIGRRLTPAELPQLIDLAFIALPGPFGGDGELQELLQALQIPFTGCDAESCRAIADHERCRQLLSEAGLRLPAYQLLDRAEWIEGVDTYQGTLNFPIRILPARHPLLQDERIIEKASDLEDYTDAVNKAFFRELIPIAHWRSRSLFDRIDHLRLLTDIEDGLGFPLDVHTPGAVVTVYHPEQLLQYLDEQAAQMPHDAAFVLEHPTPARQVRLEELPGGQAFSCLVVEQAPGVPLPLLPVSEEAAGPSFQPLDLPAGTLSAIRQAAERAFKALGCRGPVRIDGLISQQEEIQIRRVDPSPSFSPLSFCFRQLALLGLSPAQSITFFLHQALGRQPSDRLRSLETAIDNPAARQRIAVILGGASIERQQSLVAGRNIFKKLAGAEHYDPVALFLSGTEPDGPLYQLPMALLLEAECSQLEQRLDSWRLTEAEEDIIAEGRALTRRYGARDLVLRPQQLGLTDLKSWVDGVFSTLPGPPAEDGRLQARLEQLEVPFSGSDADASALVFKQQHALSALGKNGFSIPRLLVKHKEEFQDAPDAFIDTVESQLGYPMYARPAKEQSTIASRQLNKREELEAYTRLLFRREGHEGLDARYLLRIRPKEAFPRREAILFEGQVRAGGATRFVPVSIGVRTTISEDGQISYHVLPPSERVTKTEPLTLEEQYLLTAGRYLTPARFAAAPDGQQAIEAQVAKTTEQAARILNLQGYALIDGLVRVFTSGKAETIITGIQTQPVLLPGSSLFRQSVAAGLRPAELVTGIVEFGQARQQPLPTPTAEEAPIVSEEPAWVGTIEEEPAAFPEAAPIPEEAPPISFQPRSRPKASPSPVLEGLKRSFRSIMGFIFSPFFLKNLFLLVSLGALLLVLTNWVLKVYTHHGESLEVHNYIGMQLDEAEKMANSRSFQIVISDSIFQVDQPPRTILEQHPAPFSRVKEDRRIYLTITSSTAPMVTLPNLEGAYNYETYRRKLLRLGIESTIRERKFDNKLEENTILYFYYDGRKVTENDLRSGVKIPKGSTLEFVVTERLSDQVPAPDLICKRYEEASFLITATNLVMGEVYGDVNDRSEGYIYQQDPEPGVMMRMGEQIDIYLSSRRPRGCPEVQERRPENPENTIEEDPFGTGG